MTKSATEVMQEIVFAAVVDAIVALKAASKGVPNTLLRDLNAVHANTAFEDLPEALRETMPASVRAAFTRLLKEGYSVSPGRPAPAAPPPRRDHVPRGPRHGGPGGRSDAPRGPRGPGGDGGRGGRPGGGRPRPPGKPGGGGRGDGGGGGAKS
ncbi:MAG: hypothetical protein JOZ90_14025 [Alphaproteobacteria bacterium]|nr:hypothetical protein [Alphaproteobacteria bacterium]MBV9902189.1 hypothetical protein [Alphaproteobacteria bacterium]